MNLQQRYPLLFSRDPKNLVSMFGLECGSGWMDIIEGVCMSFYKDYEQAKSSLEYWSNAIEETRARVGDELIEKNVKEYQEKLDKAIKEMPMFTQIKEKNGSLRIYTHGFNDRVSDVIDFAEFLSSRTCEKCGNRGKTYGIGWNKTLCEPHAIERYGQESVTRYNSQENEMEDNESSE